MKIIPTRQQIDIVDTFCGKEQVNENSHLVVQAGAGASKTTTLLMVSERMNQFKKRGAYLAFNKLIVEEARNKFTGAVIVKTVHSMAYNGVDRAYISKLNNPSMYKSRMCGFLSIQPIELEILSGDDIVYDRINKIEVIDLCNLVIEKFCQSSDTIIEKKHIPYPKKFGKLGEKNQNLIIDQITDNIVKYSRNIWKDVVNKYGKTPFKHHHYLKIWELGNPIIDAYYLMVDEAQDLNPVMLSIIEKNVMAGKKVILVGDSQQKIYEWNGAIDALLYVEEKGVESLNLSTSFRFGKNIADVANEFLEMLGSRFNLLGGNTSCDGDADFECAHNYGDVDAILTRTNAGALRAYMDCIFKNRSAVLKVNIKEIISIIDAIQDLQTEGKCKHYDLMNYNSYESLLKDIQNETADSQVAMIHEAIKIYGFNLIKEKLENMPFTAEVEILTAHKSKGCEWNRVLIYDDFSLSDKFYEKATEIPLEYLRLCYVASTRPKEKLDCRVIRDVEYKINSLNARLLEMESPL